jgi:hypothetical protein
MHEHDLSTEGKVKWFNNQTFHCISLSINKASSSFYCQPFIIEFQMYKLGPPIWLKARFAKMKSPASKFVHDINKPAKASRGLRFFITDVIICP